MYGKIRPTLRNHGPQAVADSSPHRRRELRLHVRGLIAKVAHTYRWRVTDSGHQLLSTMITLYYRTLQAVA